MPKLRYNVKLHGVILYSTNDFNIANVYKHYTGVNAVVEDTENESV